MNLTTHAHSEGAIVGFNESLTVIGGLSNTAVEVFDGTRWIDSVIPAVGIKAEWNALAVLDTLYIFGKSLLLI